MKEQNNDNSPAFMEATSRKFEDQEKKIGLLEEKLDRSPDNLEILKDIRDSLNDFRTETKASQFTFEKLNEFSSSLDVAIGLLGKPVKNEVQHHHHIPKLLWITAGLFIVLSLVCAGWFNTYSKLDGYIASDTKYRFIRLDTAQSSLQSWLDRVDSLCSSRPDLRKHVLETESKNQQNMERLLKADRLKAEAKDLEKSVREK